MIKVGTDLMRAHIDDQIWIKSLVNAVKNSKAYENDGYCFVTDVRYKNEAQAIKDMGGILLYIDRANNPHVDSAAQHSSENEINQDNCLDLGFIKIFNDEGIEKFQRTAGLIFNSCETARYKQNREGFIPANARHYQLPVKFIDLPPSAQRMIVDGTVIWKWDDITAETFGNDSIYIQITFDRNSASYDHESEIVLTKMFNEIMSRVRASYLGEILDKRTYCSIEQFVNEHIATFLSHKKFGVYNY